jgi:hypothetical protein
VPEHDLASLVKDMMQSDVKLIDAKRSVFEKMN